MLRLLLPCLALVSLLMLPAPGMAQSDSASSEATSAAGLQLTPQEAKALSQLLADQATLDKLRGRLDAVAKAAEAAPAAPPKPQPGLVKQIAGVTQEAAESTAKKFRFS